MGGAQPGLRKRTQDCLVSLNWGFFFTHLPAPKLPPLWLVSNSRPADQAPTGRDKGTAHGASLAEPNTFGTGAQLPGCQVLLSIFLFRDNHSNNFVCLSRRERNGRFNRPERCPRVVIGRSFLSWESCSLPPSFPCIPFCSHPCVPLRLPVDDFLSFPGPCISLSSSFSYFKPYSTFPSAFLSPYHICPSWQTYLLSSQSWAEDTDPGQSQGRSTEKSPVWENEAQLS